ncbi:hypothetical protein [Hymenobacter weizhouensis]|uniref:hypothetical protein n=1 Tax=Hymenobacter sp. YIM 151500-1 TaxID=2987689 RepID=UPI002226DBD2|nr:hypothetical protein [Hymenobacter sp. YIM 151500-1]UYZ61749.1 hypothetical protein OIS53_12130 [Hymenobacter sp. YIM 151500-1]
MKNKLLFPLSPFPSLVAAAKRRVISGGVLLALLALPLARTHGSDAGLINQAATSGAVKERCYTWINFITGDIQVVCLDSPELPPSPPGDGWILIPEESPGGNAPLPDPNDPFPPYPRPN